MMRTSPFALITIDDIQAAAAMLDRLGLLKKNELIQSIDRAGEGNMNAVMRVTTSQRSVILKQSRPWVEKYPQIDAPADRILAEIDFYRRIENVDEVSCSVPRMLAYDLDARVMVLEDLGAASDYSDHYVRQDSEGLPLTESIQWLSRLHDLRVADDDLEHIGNRALRQLNHAHLYVIPLQSPSAISLDLVCEGLESVADQVRDNQRVRHAAETVGDRYLSVGKHLLHGDFYPGSWLRTDQGLRVIDPEFTFAGPREFDLGVLAAHCVLCGSSAGSVEQVCAIYKQFSQAALDVTLLHRFAGLEVIRRLIGVAQLPIEVGIEVRRRMVEIAIRWIEN